MESEQKKWMRISFIIATLLLLVSGFAFGYIYNYKKNNSCTDNPFIYGIKEMNELNNVKFYCSCRGGELNFYFNEDKVDNTGFYSNIGVYNKNE